MVLRFKIHKILDFAGKNYLDLMQQAGGEFFSGINKQKLTTKYFQRLVPLFNEWFMFEYRLPNNRTMALEYFAQNPDNLDLIASAELE